MSTTYAKLEIPRRTFKKDDSSNSFLQKAVVGSFLFHFLLFLIKFPPEKIHAPVKEKLTSIKMNYIKPNHSLTKPKEVVVEKTPAIKPIAIPEPVAKTLATAGDPKQNRTQKTQKSKSGSAKNGPLSTPHAVGATGVGDSAKKGYEFKGKGLKALMGNSSTMTLASGGGLEGAAIGTQSGKANNGNNLSGDYRAPASKGDGSGLGGKDAYGNYDHSTSTKGLANKKGIDTAFVQADTVVQGSIDPEVLRKILSEYLQQFKFCYQQEIIEQSELVKGIVDLNFRIEGDGKVSTIKIKSAKTKFSEKGIGCMSNILKMIAFPKPKGGGLVEVRQPLNFASENTKI